MLTKGHVYECIIGHAGIYTYKKKVQSAEQKILHSI